MNSQRRLIIGLMITFFSLILNLSIFVVAVPVIRAELGLPADTTSWLILVFTIPYILFMPFYGRLADLLGARRLLFAGLVVFAIGTVVCAISQTIPVLLVGRIIQGAGGASVNPLSLSIITRSFPPESRGRAVGTWNSAGPFTGIVGPALGGVLIDAFGWRSIFIPILIAIGAGFIALILIIPKESTGPPRQESIRHFDWPGMILTAVTLTGMVFYLSSRPVTGRMPFTDWRLLLVFVLGASAWILWERRHSHPFVEISLFAQPQFALASSCVSIRMMLMGAVTFLVPLYGADVLGLPAAQTGLLITLHSTALLVTIRFGGKLTDHWSRRYAVFIGMSGQSLTLLWLALFAVQSRIALIIPVTIHGGLAGLSLASLHNVAMHEVPERLSGVGAGTYSMSRFAGSMLGASVMGIVLEGWLASDIPTVNAYMRSFLVAALFGVLGVAISLFIRDADAEPADGYG